MIQSFLFNGTIFLLYGTINCYVKNLQYSPSPNSRGGLIKKRGLVIFPEEINGEGVNKWKWVDFDMQCGNKGGCQ